jgi:hypothetical protein
MTLTERTLMRAVRSPWNRGRFVVGLGRQSASGGADLISETSLDYFLAATKRRRKPRREAGFFF